MHLPDALQAAADVHAAVRCRARKVHDVFPCQRCGSCRRRSIWQLNLDKSNVVHPMDPLIFEQQFCIYCAPPLHSWTSAPNLYSSHRHNDTPRDSGTSNGERAWLVEERPRLAPMQQCQWVALRRQWCLGLSRKHGYKSKFAVTRMQGASPVWRAAARGRDRKRWQRQCLGRARLVHVEAQAT